MPSAGHSSSPTVCTVAYSAASSPGSPQAAIQFADSRTFDERADVGRENVGQRFAHREATRRRRIEHRHRRALAHGHGLAGVAEVVGEGHGDIRDRHLPRAHHLVAADHAADGAIADGNQEGLVGHRRETQHAIGGFAQVDVGERRAAPAAASRAARRAASSAPCLTTLRAACRPGACRSCWSSSTSTPVPSISPITANGQRSRRADRREVFELRGVDAEHVALLRLVAPQLHGRHAGLVVRNGARDR